MQRFKMIRTLVLSGLLITGLLGHVVEAFAAVGSFALTGSLNTRVTAIPPHCWQTEKSWSVGAGR
jgi:hypothetical protein